MKEIQALIEYYESQIEFKREHLANRAESMAETFADLAGRLKNPNYRPSASGEVQGEIISFNAQCGELTGLMSVVAALKKQVEKDKDQERLAKEMLSQVRRDG